MAMARRYSRHAALGGLMLVCAGLSACAAGPDYHAPVPLALGVPAAYSVGAASPALGADPRWWAVFGDATLSGLEEQGIRPNLDLAMAVSRLRQAREALVQAGSASAPSASVTAGFTRTQGSNLSVSNFALSGDASYQVDLFGGRARSIEAARADAQASSFSYDAVVISVRAELAYAYFQTRLAQANLANGLLAQQQQRDNLQLAQWRNQAGLIGSLDVELARSQLAQTSATIPQIEASLNTAMARIAVLTGQAPGALKAQLRMAAPIPIGPDSIVVGIPADILRQRPDLRVAERNLAAATARIGVAQAQLNPALALGGTLGTSSASLGGLLDVVSGQAFASLAQTLLDGGRRRSVVRAQCPSSEHLAQIAA